MFLTKSYLTEKSSFTRSHSLTNKKRLAQKMQIPLRISAQDLTRYS